MRSRSLVMSLAVAVLGALALASPAALASVARAVDYSPQAFPFCSWWLKTTPETMNVAFPDGAAVYWTTPFVAEAGTKYVISGTYPQARYFSITVYGQDFNYFTGPAGNVSGIADYEIDPMVPSTNPWQTTGADAGARWEVEVTPEGTGTNTLPMAATNPPTSTSSSQPFSFITMRVYVPEGTSLQTAPDSVDLPIIEKVDLTTGRSTPLAPCSDQALQQAGAASAQAAQAQKTLDTIQSGDDTYVEPCSTSPAGCPDPLTFILPSPCVTGGVFPNPNNAYLTALFTPTKGEVVVVTGLAPTSPAAVGSGTPGNAIGATPVPWNSDGGAAGYQVRYWSLANNMYESPYPMVMRKTSNGDIYSSLSDFQATLDSGQYQAVVSATKPKNLHGASWLPTDQTQPDVVENIIIRNMLPSASYTEAIQNISTPQQAAAYPCDGTTAPPAGTPYNNPSAAEQVMGAYYPHMWQCATATFEAGGAEACAGESARTRQCKAQTGKDKATCVAGILREAGITKQRGSLADRLDGLRNDRGGLNLKSLLSAGLLRQAAAGFQGQRPHLFGAEGRGQDLSRASLFGVLMPGGQFDGSKLTGLNGALGTFDGGRFRNADLSNASLSGASARGADFTGANLQQVRGHNADLTGASLKNAQASGASLQGASLRQANGAGANLSGASLQTADLTGASMTGANLSGASLQSANLTGADLTGVNAAGANASGATFSNTTMPDGTICSGSACAASLPTSVPVAVPGAAPTGAPTAVPTATPTAVPTVTPTAVPTEAPTAAPSASPSGDTRQ